MVNSTNISTLNTQAKTVWACRHGFDIAPGTRACALTARCVQ
jgi:hypothetical protein